MTICLVVVSLSKWVLLSSFWTAHFWCYFGLIFSLTNWCLPFADDKDVNDSAALNSENSYSHLPKLTRTADHKKEVNDENLNSDNLELDQSCSQTSKVQSPKSSLPKVKSTKRRRTPSTSQRAKQNNLPVKSTEKSQENGTQVKRTRTRKKNLIVENSSAPLKSNSKVKSKCFFNLGFLGKKQLTLTCTGDLTLCRANCARP